MTDTDTTDTKAPPPPPPPVEERRSGVVGLILLIGGIVALGLLTRASIVVVILAIIVMVFMHELGHYLTAKWSGMKVTEFFIGFGPRIWSFRRGETEYGVKAIPAGAYVRIIGMHNLEEVPPEDEPRTYRQKSFPRRLSVALAGSTMHFVMALVCIYAILVSSGAAEGRLFDTRSLEQIDRATPWMIGEVSDDSGAEAAGLRPGDRILEIDGEPIVGFGDLPDEIAPRAGDDVTLLVRRGEREFEVGATIGRDEHGDGLLGVTVDRQFDMVSYGPSSAVPQAFREFGRVTSESLRALGRFFTPSGLSGFYDQVADGGEEAGESAGNGSSGGGGGDNRIISILGATRIGADATEQGFEGLLFFLVVLNVFVGIFNLVPLLPLDGGHVAIAVYERVRSRKGRPYHADVAKLLPLTYVVVLLLITLGVTAMYLDIVNPVSID
ncbi:MAG: M50 family metallopeptidase [Acidimicrobiales bacterium]